MSESKNRSQQLHNRKLERHLLGKAISFTSDGEVNSRQYDVKWDFSGTEKKAQGKNSIVSFAKTNLIYREVIQNTLYDMFAIHKNINAQEPTSSMLNAWKSGLQHIASALCSTEWAKIDTRSGFRSFKAQLKKLRLGEGTLDKVANALNRLREGGFVDRIVDKRTLTALQAKKSTKQHVAIPSNMYQQLLSKTISMVETYHPHRNEISRVMKEAYEIRERVKAGENVLEGFIGNNNSNSLSMDLKAMSSRWINASRLLIKHNIPEFKIDFSGSQMGVIQTVCEMVTQAFSGARIGEVISFGNDSYSTKLTDSGKEISVLSGETSKGNDGKPKTETWQTHPIVKDAIELAYDMTELLRDGYRVKIESMLKSDEFTIDHYNHSLKEIESAFIPIKQSTQQNTFVSTNQARTFNELMKAFDIKATEKDVEEFNLLNPSREGELKVGGHLPKLTPHDFRRTFAVFFKRYGFGNASGIKFQYKHENINMSDYYSNNAELMKMHDVLLDEDLLKIMYDEGVNLGVDIYDDIYNGSEHLSGEGGERIAQDKFKKMKAGHEVYMSRAEIELLVRNGSLAAIQLPTGGYCTNGDCERICGMGLFISEKKPCVHKVNTDKTAKVLSRQRKRLIRQFQGLNSGDTMMASILVGIKQKIKEIEVTLVKHEIRHDAFEDKVRGLIDVKS